MYVVFKKRKKKDNLYKKKLIFFFFFLPEVCFNSLNSVLSIWCHESYDILSFQTNKVKKK